jgi:hypothetical protein
VQLLSLQRTQGADAPNNDRFRTGIQLDSCPELTQIQGV